MIIAVNDAGSEDPRSILIQPKRYALDGRQPFRTWPPGVPCIRVELRPPPRYLPLEIIFRASEIGEPQRLVVDLTQSGDRVDQSETHAVPNVGRIRMRRRQAAGRVEAFDRLHQVECGTQYGLITARRD